MRGRHAHRILSVAREARGTVRAFMQNFFEQRQSAALILLDALGVGGLSASVHLRDGERGMAARVNAFGTGALCASLSISLVLLTAAGAAVQAQSSQPKPVTGFVSTFEIMRTVRSAGFDPLVPPLREGTTYVLRATDFRGILMRVVLDARTGSIRDVTRIVPATPMGTMPPSYGGPAYGPPPTYSSAPYGSPAQLGAPTGMGPGGASGQVSQPASPAVTTPARPQSPPPRVKPTEQASQKPGSGIGTSANVAPTTGTNGTSNTSTNGAVQARATAATKPETTATVPPAVPAPAGKTPPVPPIND
jgi:hypothetical protein